MRKRALFLGAMVGALASLAFSGHEARACGGCFHPPPSPSESPSVITDHRMVLSISAQQTTLYDQIRYQGSPSSFAWVLPISGVAQVGLSADVVFASLDEITKVYLQKPYIYCPGPPSTYCPGEDDGVGGHNGGDGAPVAADAGFAPPPVTVTKEETVGPYETVQLKADDPNALIDWLTSHNFDIPSDVKPIITAYTNEHFGFLAMKLIPGANVKSMRPVRVTTPGASPILPLRMVAAGTGATVGITLWTIGEGRYETQNFPSFTIGESDLVWDFATDSSNYAPLRAAREAALGGRGWQIESSIPAIPQQFINFVMTDGTQYSQADAGSDYAPQPFDGGVKGPDQVRQEDLDTLFKGMNVSSVRITRMRSDLAKSALSTDLILRASADQSILQNQISIQKNINAPACPTYPPAPPCPPVTPGGRGRDAGVIHGTFPWNDGTSGGGTRESFSCATSAGGGAATGVATAALVGLVAIAGARGSRRRRRAGEAREAGEARDERAGK
jgi:hypothetical protein